MVTTPGATTQTRLSIEVFARVEDACADWRTLYAQTSASPYQDYDYARLWAATIGRAEGLEPAIVVVRGARGAPYALFPFATRASRVGLRVAEYICGRESNLNVPLILPGAKLDILACLRAAASAMPDPPALFLLRSQPRRFNGETNPLAPFWAQESPSAAYGAAFLGPRGSWRERQSSSSRKRLRYDRRKLQAQGALAFEHAVEGARRQDIVATLCAQKMLRLAHLGAANPFSRPAMSDFLDAAAQQGVLETHALSLDRRIIATYAGVARAGRFSILANSFDPDRAVARFSPGDVLLHALLENLEERGFTEFDLGIGEAAYKNAVCDEKTVLYDAIVPVTTAGALAAPLFAAATRAKREVKRRPWLIRPLERLRRRALPASA